jgi:hypothetical protein
MKTLVAALALLSLAAEPAFAAGSPSFGAAQFGYHYGMPTAPGEVNIPNPSGGIPGA